MIMYKRPFVLLVLLLISLCVSAQEELKEPSFEEILALRSASSPKISPDGRHVAFSVRRTDWKNNRYDQEIWLSKDGGSPFQLTRTKKGSSFGHLWSPDGQWLAFLADRGNKNQIYVLRLAGGEAQQVTNEKEGIRQFEWSPGSDYFIFTKQEPEEKEDKNRKERFGSYEVDDGEYKHAWLYKIAFDPAHPLPSDLPCYKDIDSTAQQWPCIEWPTGEALIDSVDFTIRDFSISPDGSKIAITHAPNNLINSFMDTDISLYDLAADKLEKVVANKSSDSFEAWSPDGKLFLYTSSLDDRKSNFYRNDKLYKYELASGQYMQLARNFDENFRGLEWTPAGIYGLAVQRTQVHLFQIDPYGGSVQRMLETPKQIYDIDFSADGTRLSFYGSNGDNAGEVYVSTTAEPAPEAISAMSAQFKDWKVARSQVIDWRSKDGTTIEGVLHKPMDYDSSRQYPLLVVIHGGPTGVDFETPILSYVYPVNQWLNKGALVLRVNYRGSAGYGEAFRALNVRNLGVGDAWDVLSGVDHLIGKGIVDSTRMGAMGWSQGGYISAFLTTTTNRFKAISVGAGISNWMTYYVNTDIHPFTRQYLKATPWQDEDIYRKTSPMTYITQASTPTLIQHGENDRRVPIPNAYELLQGLRDQDVDARLIIYKGFGHGITKPKERLAAMQHNWEWFNKYLWGEKEVLTAEK